MFASFIALLQVIIIDIIMSGDNAVAIALPVRHLPPALKKKALLWGSVFAAFLRILLAFIGIYLIQYPVIKVVGALLLVVMALHLGYTIVKPPREDDSEDNVSSSLKIAIGQIIIADITTSLENILAVTSASYTHPYAMVIGIILSIILVVTIASKLSHYLEKYPMISWIGVVIIILVAINLGHVGLSETLSQYHLK